ncbi:hypothetical protein FD723_31050 [Nostoc sp. C052]|uniref:hypothetical protein n=1 Tax=Nostoc sp. C052 TaxID=2576902 RepID=UPI0015C365A5|nr:hypothetical protein [Nostoc sp. C052]QLE44424.1 hypothetical protein FD723_31050 [Nostoc sp. C052]
MRRKFGFWQNIWWIHHWYAVKFSDRSLNQFILDFGGRYFEDSNEATLVTNGNGYMSGVAPYVLNPNNADRLWEAHRADDFQSS